MVVQQNTNVLISKNDATYTLIVLRAMLICSVRRTSSEFIVGCIDGPEH